MASPPTNLYIADYGGTITTAALQKHQDESYTLTKTHTFHDAGPNPSWLTAGTTGTLYSVNEGLKTRRGSLTALRTASSGQLSQLATQDTLPGPVSSVLSVDGTHLTLAHYAGSGVTHWRIDADGSALVPVQESVYTLESRGPVADRQDAPHPHQALRDPSGSYVLVPDLGADLMRVYKYRQGAAAKLGLKECAPLLATSGSGPRHGVFREAMDGLYFYLVGELDSSVTAYRVRYPAPSIPAEEKGDVEEDLQFEKVAAWSTFGDVKGPAGNAPAEIAVTPDNRFLIISNRGDSLLLTLSADGTTERKSDSLCVFAFLAGGMLRFHQLAPAGGRFPRHFSLNRNGTLVAVCLQTDGEVAVLRRDPGTGLVMAPVARLNVGAEVTCVIWDEGWKKAGPRER